MKHSERDRIGTGKCFFIFYFNVLSILMCACVGVIGRGIYTPLPLVTKDLHLPLGMATLIFLISVLFFWSIRTNQGWETIVNDKDVAEWMPH